MSGNVSSLVFHLKEWLREWEMRRPSSLLGRFLRLRYGMPKSTHHRDTSEAPDTVYRVLITPVNYSGQGTRWARALEAKEDTGARSLALNSPMRYEADALVSRQVFYNSFAWQKKQLRSAQKFSHILVEAVCPPLGGLRGGDIVKQLQLFNDDVDFAMLCHGTDVRTISPKNLLGPEGERNGRAAAHNRSLLARLGVPIFVSTPDLLQDIPEATWLPVVVDVPFWTSSKKHTASRRLTGSPLNVFHAPSKASVKGTALIEPVVFGLHNEGIINYTSVKGVLHSEMPDLVQHSDVVLDQFVLGSYGVAACEAMISGKVVVGHVSPAVRSAVYERTGFELPIVEATPETLSVVLRSLAADPGICAKLGRAGMAFVREVHDGRFSAQILFENWISPGSRSLF